MVDITPAMETAEADDNAYDEHIKSLPVHSLLSFDRMDCLETIDYLSYKDKDVHILYCTTDHKGLMYWNKSVYELKCKNLAFYSELDENYELSSKQRLYYEFIETEHEYKFIFKKF